ncbi:MAG TPA: MFS transporter [Actinomycetota bacterium]|nr:MFS transporter [Actinomycetota bacterium]
MSPEPKPSARLMLSQGPVRAVIAVTFVMMIGFGLIAPILPLFARSFGVGYAGAGVLLSAFGLGRLLFDLVAGPLVDRFGERACGAAGLAFVAVSALATSLAPSYGIAVVLWGAGGAGSALAFAALYSYLLKAVPADEMARTLGLFYGSFNAGIIAGAPLGGWLADRFGLASPLVAYCALLACAALLFLRTVSDPPPRQAVDAPVGTRVGRRVIDLFALRGFVTALVLNFSYLWMVLAVYDTLVPLFARDELGLSPATIGTVLAIALAVELVVLYPAGWAADRRGRKAVLVPSFAALLVAIGLLGWAASLAAFGALMALLGLASGVAGVPPAAVLSDVVPPDRSGAAVGVFRFCGDLGFFLGPAAAGAAVNAAGFRGAFLLVTIPVALALALTVATPETLARAYRKKNDTAMMR